MGVHRDDYPAGGQSSLGTGADRDPDVLTLSSDLFLIMLDDRSGKPRVRAAPVALAGAVLAELLGAGNITLAGGRLGLTAAQPPTDPLLMRAMGWIMTEPGQSDLVYWLRCLASLVVDEIASRLVAGGWIQLVERGTFRVRTIYRPVNANDVFWRAARLFHHLVERPSFGDLVLYGLIDAVDFTTVAFRPSGGMPPQLHDRIVGHLVEHSPDYVGLINTVRALAAQNAITLRG